MKMAKTPIGRVSFESVWEKSSMEEDQVKKYGVTLIFPKSFDDPAQQALYDAMVATADKLSIEKFGCKMGARSKASGKIIKNPFRDGAEKSHIPGYSDDVVFVRFSGKLQPAIVDCRKRPIDRDSGDFYNGCFCHLVYNAYHYTKGNHGIAFGLGNIQKVRDGESFGAGLGNTDKEFDEVEEEVSAADGIEDGDTPF